MGRWKKPRRTDERLIVWRSGRAYGDLRAYDDVGGVAERPSRLRGRPGARMTTGTTS